MEVGRTPPLQSPRGYASEWALSLFIAWARYWNTQIFKLGEE